MVGSLEISKMIEKYVSEAPKRGPEAPETTPRGFLDALESSWDAFGALPGCSRGSLGSSLGRIGRCFGVLWESLAMLFGVMVVVRRVVEAKMATYSKMLYLTALLLCR